MEQLIPCAARPDLKEENALVVQTPCCLRHLSEWYLFNLPAKKTAAPGAEARPASLRHAFWWPQNVFTENWALP